MSTYFVYTLHCQPAAAHQVLHHFRCGWPLVELPAGAASLQSPVALLAALEPICISTDHFSKMQMWEGTQKKMVHLAGSQDRHSQETRTLHKYPLVCMHALNKQVRHMCITAGRDSKSPETAVPQTNTRSHAQQMVQQLFHVQRVPKTSHQDCLRILCAMLATAYSPLARQRPPV